MKEQGILKNIYEEIIKEIQTLITIAYILAVAIGMLFTHQKYSEFRINIFDYSDVFDFLIAPFTDVKILLFTLASILIVVFILRFDTFYRKKYPKLYSWMNFKLDKKPWFNSFRYASFAFLFILYLYLSSDIYGDITAKEIRKQASINLKYSDNETIKGIVIGKTNEVIFLLKDEKVKAIPITSLVKEFEIK